MNEGNWIKVEERIPIESGLYYVKTNHNDSGKMQIPFVTTLSGRLVWLWPSPEDIIEWLEINIKP